MKLPWYGLALLSALGGCSVFDFSEPTAPDALGGAGSSSDDAGASGTPAGGNSAALGGQTATAAGQSNGGKAEPGTSGSGGTAGAATTSAGRTGTGGGGRAGSNGIGSAGASGEPGFQDCESAAPFPSLTTPLDIFDRTGPELGGNWDVSGLTDFSESAKLSPGYVTIELPSSIANIVEWVNPSTGFGNAQEVWSQISNLTSQVTAVALWMRGGRITIQYHQQDHFLDIEYDGEGHYELVKQKNFTLPTSGPVVLGGRAFPNGCVQLFVNGQMKLHAYLQDGNPKPSDDYITGDGVIGFAAEGPVHFEKFGGGTLEP